jgi:hypothetical protein
MRQPQTSTTWTITCRSAADCVALRELLSDRLSLDRVLVQTIQTWPGTVEHQATVSHRLGDYFSAIHLVPESGNGSTSLLLVFHRRPDAGRYWKDLMVNVLQEIEASSLQPMIELKSTSEKEPESSLSVG